MESATMTPAVSDNRSTRTRGIWTQALGWKAACTALVLLSMSAAVTAPALAETGRSVLVVLDASGSMNAQLPEGRTRLEAAKAAVGDLVGSIAPDTRLALRVYGHQSTPDQKNCQDSELVAGFAPVSEGRAALLDKVGGLKARGYTPITLSLQLAAQDIVKEPSAERTVVLVSDGRETCRADPCIAAKALAAADAKLVIHTVGLGVDAAARSQLQCIASVVRGSYFDAGSRAELAAVLGKAAVTEKKVVVTAPKASTGILSAPRMKDTALIYEAETEKLTNKVIGGPFREQRLPVGIYNVTLINGSWSGIEIKAGEKTLLDPATLRVEGSTSENVNLLDPETGEAVGYFNPIPTPEPSLLPGRFIPQIGKFDWPALDLKPGQTVVLRLSGIKVNDPSQSHQFYYVTLASGGPEALFVSNKFLPVPPGKYLLWHSDSSSQKTEIEVAEGHTVEVNIRRQ
jgi:hypothetical protein